MDDLNLFLVIGFSLSVFFAGAAYGAFQQNRCWRRKGDHEYMNRMESGGRLYQVKRESNVTL